MFCRWSMVLAIGLVPSLLVGCGDKGGPVGPEPEPLACVWPSEVDESASVVDVPEVPLMMEGYRDSRHDQWFERVPNINIISGTTESPDLVARLRSEGVLFSYHVSLPRSAATVAEYVCELSEPYRTDFGGKLPGGFDAITIDEVGKSFHNDAPKARLLADALRELKRLYPNRIVIVYGVWQLLDSIIREENDRSQYSYILDAIAETADLFAYEAYINETSAGRHKAILENWVGNLKPNLAPKTLFVLRISQTDPFYTDDDILIDFHEFLSSQVMFLRENRDISPGVGFWPFYRARHTTTRFVNRMIEHYYRDGSTSFFGRNDLSQLAKNPSFENGTDGWVLQAFGSGTVSLADYDTLGIPAYHGSESDGVTHGSTCLRMERGSARNEARQTKRLEPGGHYVLYAFVLGFGTADMVIWDTSTGLRIAAGTYSDLSLSEWTLVELEFDMPLDQDQISFRLSDSASQSGALLYWDFVEILETPRD